MLAEAQIRLVQRQLQPRPQDQFTIDKLRLEVG
jgi:hypothetical protein